MHPCEKAGASESQGVPGYPMGKAHYASAAPAKEGLECPTWKFSSSCVGR